MSAESHAIRTVEQLLEVLDLDSTQARTTEDIFTGASHPMPTGRIYGGQVLAQSLIAAERTLPRTDLCIRCTATSCARAIPRRG